MASAMQQPAGEAGEGFTTHAERRAMERERSERARRLQELELQREHILSQRTSHPARRDALAAALAHIETQIAALG